MLATDSLRAEQTRSPYVSPAARLLDQLRDVIRVKHYSIRTEESYVEWVRRFVHFCKLKHPRECGSPEVEAFLTHLARDANVSASTQNQARSALLFLYKEVLGTALPWLDNVEVAKRPAKLPVVLTRHEVELLFSHLDGTAGLILRLLYGTGMRVLEALRLRVKDVDFSRHEIIVREGVAICFSFAAAVRGSAQRYCSSPPRGSAVHPACLARCASALWRFQIGNAAHAPAFVRYALARPRLRHSYGSGITRPQGRFHDDDLHTRAE
jgi:integrase